MNKLSGEKICLILIAGFSVLVFVLILAFSANESKQNKGSEVSTYSSTDNQKPKAVISSLFSDLGNMKVNDEKTANFTIENKGSKTLQLFKIESSCDCTFAQVTIDNVKSQEFSMHAKTNWVGSVEPGKKADLAVIYRPFIMPVKGVITRDVFVQTNDPDQKSLTFTVKAFIE